MYDNTVGRWIKTPACGIVRAWKYGESSGFARGIIPAVGWSTFIPRNVRNCCDGCREDYFRLKTAVMCYTHKSILKFSKEGGRRNTVGRIVDHDQLTTEAGKLCKKRKEGTACAKCPTV